MSRASSRVGTGRGHEARTSWHTPQTRYHFWGCRGDEHISLLSPLQFISHVALFGCQASRSSYQMAASHVI